MNTGEIIDVGHLDSGYIRDILDPNGKIPTDYSLSFSEEYPWYNGLGSTINLQLFSGEIGERLHIGHARLNIHTGEYVCFDGVKVSDEEYRGRGYGLALYLEAILYAHSRGLPFRTQDWNQTKHAVKIWTLLHTLGIAREVEPFRFDHYQPDEDPETGNLVDQPRYKGVYIIDIPEPSL
jgi:GNAT superfamily N-acetyltransferase